MSNVVLVVAVGVAAVVDVDVREYFVRLVLRFLASRAAVCVHSRLYLFVIAFLCYTFSDHVLVLCGV